MDNIKHKIGQMVMVGFRGTELLDTNHIISDIKDLNVGGVVIYEYDVPTRSRPRNIVSVDQTKKLISDLKKLSETPLLIGIDQEGGIIVRLKEKYGWQKTISHQKLGELDDPDTTRYWSDIIAKQLYDLGINLNFAPVVDVNVNTECPVIAKFERSISADPDMVIKHARIFIKEHNKYNIYCTLKHLPGHGSSEDDSHLGFVDVTNTWIEDELLPYREIIKDKSKIFIMTAHVFNENLDPKYPATLSKKIMYDILRKKYQYNGIIISDDMQMKAITEHYGFETAIELSINAGIDILIFSNNIDHYDPDIAKKAINTIYKLVQQEKITIDRIEQSFNRIKKVKTSLK